MRPSSPPVFIDRSPEKDPMLRAVVPIGRSGWAIAAGYLGLLVVTAPLAIVAGIFGIREIRRDPEKHGLGRCIFGIVMGVLVTAVFTAAYFR